jgi:hypothetical protein
MILRILLYEKFKMEEEYKPIISYKYISSKNLLKQNQQENPFTNIYLSAKTRSLRH